MVIDTIIHFMSKQTKGFLFSKLNLEKFRKQRKVKTTTSKKRKNLYL